MTNSLTAASNPITPRDCAQASCDRQRFPRPQSPCERQTTTHSYPANHSFVVGLLGGMGTYATLHIFRRYAKLFPASKEWERPRLVIDNRCTMPSRVRAFLTGEGREQLVAEMTDSLRHLLDVGCTHIILGCNTSHLFLPAIFDSIPALRPKVVDIIDTCVAALVSASVSEVFLLATEGTIESHIYQNVLAAHGIHCTAPAPAEYSKIRFCIEAVKQNRFSDSVRNSFLSLLRGHAHCILGCTELPVLLERYRLDLATTAPGCLYDPVDLALLHIHKEFLAIKTP